MLGAHDGAQASEPGEIVLLAAVPGWYDYEAKYTPGGMDLVVPARISRGGAGRGPRARDARVPRRAAAAASPAPTSSSTATRVLLNELNTMPGFTETSVYGEALGRAAGCPTPSSSTASCALAVERHARGARATRF